MNAYVSKNSNTLHKYKIRIKSGLYNFFEELDYETKSCQKLKSTTLKKFEIIELVNILLWNLLSIIFVFNVNQIH